MGGRTGADGRARAEEGDIAAAAVSAACDGTLGREGERGEEIERTFVNETVNLVRGDNEVWRWDGLGWFKLERLLGIG